MTAARDTLWAPAIISTSTEMSRQDRPEVDHTNHAGGLANNTANHRPQARVTTEPEGPHRLSGIEGRDNRLFNAWPLARELIAHGKFNQ